MFALYSVLAGIGRQTSVGPLTGELVREADAATLLGAPLSGTLWDADAVAGVLVPAVLIVVMYAAQVLTQRLSARNNPPTDPTNPLARQQGMLAFVLPALSAVVAVGFPVGVVVYWATSSLWGWDSSW
ncbi:YidC/Oxa1 family membrane protein insertase [Oerskovia sp. M15]